MRILQRLMNLAPDRSLRSRIALLMGMMGLLLGVIVTAVIDWRLEAYTLEAQQHALNVAANEVGGRLASDLRARKREIMLATGLLEKTRMSQADDVRALIQKLKEEQSSYAWIGWANGEGKVLAATDGLLEGADVSMRPWFSGAQKGLFLGDPHDAKLLARFMPPKQTTSQYALWTWPLPFMILLAMCRACWGRICIGAGSTKSSTTWCRSWSTLFRCGSSLPIERVGSYWGLRTSL